MCKTQLEIPIRCVDPVRPPRDLAVGYVENKDGRFLILENDGIGGHLKRGDRWEPHFTKLVQGLVRPGAVVVDAGAPATGLPIGT